MLRPKKDMKLFVSLEPVDMRKSINGLIIEVIESLGAHPQSGDLFVFKGRKSNMIKALFWDSDGFVLISKRLEKYTFKFPKKTDDPVLFITTSQLRWLLSGFEFSRINEKSKLKFDDYF